MVGVPRGEFFTTDYTDCTDFFIFSREFALFAVNFNSTMRNPKEPTYISRCRAGVPERPPDGEPSGYEREGPTALNQPSPLAFASLPELPLIVYCLERVTDVLHLLCAQVVVEGQCYGALRHGLGHGQRATQIAKARRASSPNTGESKTNAKRLALKSKKRLVPTEYNRQHLFQTGFKCWLTVFLPPNVFMVGKILQARVVRSVIPTYL